MVQVNDLGIGRIRKQLTELGKLKIFVGVQGDKASEVHPDSDGATVGEIAFWLHFGTETIVARPWADRAIKQIKDRVIVRIRQSAADLIDGRADTAVEALQPIAEQALEAVMGSFDSAEEWAEPLSQSTISHKGHSQPLINGGTLRDANSWTIRKGGAVLAEGGIDQS